MISNQSIHPTSNDQQPQQDKDEIVEANDTQNDGQTITVVCCTTTSAGFDPHSLLCAFQESITKSVVEETVPVDDVKLKDYLRAYEEITKFLEHLGTVFYFVIVDVKEKIGILRDFHSTNPNDYDTILKTVCYEKNVINAFHQSSPLAKTNGSRTILRLHRALIFIYMFIERLFSADAKVKSSQICTEVYESTLAKHHGWFVRKAATFGMLALPRREYLVSYMCRTPEDHVKFPTFVKCVEHVYDITQRIYEQHDILDLP